MKTKEYIKSKAIALFLWVSSLIFTFCILNIYSIPKYTITYIMIVISLAFIIPITIDFFKKRHFYNSLESTIAGLEKRFLLSEVIEEPNFLEGEKLYETLKIVSKSMNDEIAKYKIKMSDYQEYVEKWVHEIKTPIAAAKLVTENKNINSWDELSEELDKIENYVNQTLFFSRVNNVEKDYIIRKKTLDEIVSKSLKVNSKSLIKNRFSINRDNLNISVMTDEKWTTFIIGQIISNSVKYKSENPKISFVGEKSADGVSLKIIDNGMGIKASDLPRIFEKNFTGGNGRLNKHSTGFGLYLCKKLCTKMGISISAFSDFRKGTEIILFFPKNRFTNL